MTACLIGTVLSVQLVLVPAQAKAGGPDPKDVQAVADKAIAFLRTRQSPDGSFSARRAGPGVSALVASALLRNGVGADDPLAAKTMAYLEKSVKPDGGIYDRGLANYTTSVAVMTFKEANSGGKYDTVIKNAAAFLKGLQYAKVDATDPRYGGVGYDGRQRP